MLFTAVLLAAAAAPAEDAPKDPAEVLFRKMEKKLADAERLSFRFAAEIEPKNAGPFKGRLAAAPGNKHRVEVEGTANGKEVKLVMVSDGAKSRITGTDLPGQDQDTRKDIGAMLRVAVARVGLLPPLFLLGEVRSADDPPKKDEFDREKTFAVSGLKLGKKEMVGTVEAQAVEYTVTFKGMKETLKVTTWIDPKSDLPVKRVLKVTEGGTAITVTETYTDLLVGGQADDKDFVLPTK